jgi:hypothetical protein
MKTPKRSMALRPMSTMIFASCAADSSPRKTAQPVSSSTKRTRL